jgi:hypothetical protein
VGLVDLDGMIRVVDLELGRESAWKKRVLDDMLVRDYLLMRPHGRERLKRFQDLLSDCWV